MNKIEAYELIGHGVDHPQFFQGCGVACTPYDFSATGIGDNELDALHDCLEQLEDMDIDTEALGKQIWKDQEITAEKENQMLTDSASALYPCECGEEDCICEDEIFYYVSICEYWVEVTERQNPYDLTDEPVEVDGIPLDPDGEWMFAFDRSLAAQLGLEASELYGG